MTPTGGEASEYTASGRCPAAPRAASRPRACPLVLARLRGGRSEHRPLQRPGSPSAGLCLARRSLSALAWPVRLLSPSNAYHLCVSSPARGSRDVSHCFSQRTSAVPLKYHGRVHRVVLVMYKNGQCRSHRSRPRDRTGVRGLARHVAFWLSHESEFLNVKGRNDAGFSRD